jgi:hypothetical protein
MISMYGEKLLRGIREEYGKMIGLCSIHGIVAPFSFHAGMMKCLVVGLVPDSEVPTGNLEDIIDKTWETCEGVGQPKDNTIRKSWEDRINVATRLWCEARGIPKPDVVRADMKTVYPAPKGWTVYRWYQKRCVLRLRWGGFPTRHGVTDRPLSAGIFTCCHSSDLAKWCNKGDDIRNTVVNVQGGIWIGGPEKFAAYVDAALQMGSSCFPNCGSVFGSGLVKLGSKRNTKSLGASSYWHESRFAAFRNDNESVYRTGYPMIDSKQDLHRLWRQMKAFNIHICACAAIGEIKGPYLGEVHRGNSIPFALASVRRMKH